MTSLLTLSADIRQNEIFKERIGIFARIFTKKWIKIYVLYQRDAGHVAGDRARTFMSRIAMRASSIIYSFIFVLCH